LISKLAAFCLSPLLAAGQADAVYEALRAALLGEPRATPATPLGLDVRRQDHGEFQRNQSVLKTPLRLGDRSYPHGLGTHATSEIVVRLSQPARLFTAEVGVDHNHDTQGRRGSVVFVVEVGGREAFRSGVRRASDPPLPVSVELGGARELTLRVFDAGDGPSWDQADWAAAAVTLADGTRQWLDELPVALPLDLAVTSAPPFSFLLAGQSSNDLLPTWQVTREPFAARGGEGQRVSWRDPASGLVITSEVTPFPRHHALDWVLRVTNTGAADAPLLEALRPLDLRLALAPQRTVTLHRAHGSTCQPTDFLPLADTLGDKAEVRLAPNGGRSSDGCLPFFNLDWGEGGLLGAVGWSGQWALTAQRSGRALTLQAGQQTTKLRLRPGESIRTPRLLLLAWDGGERLRGHNAFRRLLLEHYAPRVDGQVALPPVSQNTWFVLNTGNDVTERNQLEAITGMARLGVEAYWLDAGWFEGGWPSGVGSWVPKAAAFPRGLKPLGDEARRRGMGFVLWFEPERVSPTSRIAREHPEWVLRAGEGDGLLNLGDDAARAWLTDYLSRCITDWGITVYRQDFNIAPLRFWQAADGPERQGLAEIRYLEGLYALWDELRRRHPGLTIDNCASGGRRLDLETCSRSYPLWRSDTQCGGQALPTADQVQTAGLSLWLPLHAAGVWSFEPYAFRSVATTGTSVCPDTRGLDATALAQGQRALAEIKRLRPLWLGDYYPLLPINLHETVWCGWQCHRADLGQGFAMLFRRPRSPYSRAQVALQGLDAQATYQIEHVDTGRRERLTGAQLGAWEAEIAEAGRSLLVVYERDGAPGASASRR